MSANVIGALVGAAWLSMGAGVLWLLLFKTRLLEGAQLRNGIASDGLRRQFKWVAAAAAFGGGVVGWIGGPILFGGR
jgi:hypothetical protein